MKSDLEIGEDFHAQLAKLVPEDQHPPDSAHDEAVGRALRRTIEAGEPEEAVAEYNAWAEGAAYAKISYLGAAEDGILVDICTAIIRVGADYKVHLMLSPMKVRILPPEEWHRLKGTELEKFQMMLPPTAQVIVVEQGREIIGTWCAYTMVHAEGVWISPSHRGKAAVAKALIQALNTVVTEVFGSWLYMTGAATPQVEALIKRLGGAEVPGKHFVVGIPESFSASEEVA